MTKTRGRVDPHTVGIVTTAGTGQRIANEISAVIAAGQETGPRGEMALRVVATVGSGGIQDIRDLLTKPGVDMSITPAILVDFVRATKALSGSAQKIVYIAPLYTEEVHVIARPDIQSIADLAGKAVNLGAPGGAADILGRELLNKMNLRVWPVNIGQHDALERIRTGELAATFIIEGKPLSWLHEYRRDAGFHLVPVPASLIVDDVYFPTTLTADDYPNLIAPGKSVETVAVLTALMVYDWPERSNRRRLLQSFVYKFFSHFAEFSTAPHHPKWKEVNLAAVLPGWRRFGPAESWLRQYRGDDPQFGSVQSGAPLPSDKLR
ncbi:TAXI family TRAP transporter solute-binding subunit [Methylobacterium nodulans]|uniref:TAXI family TRAP transporter solute-binding subunit n=1 Tax=Methylobacterium nodulans TaxID=114616 RepID=UPI001FCA63D8|nr:TAXI family TRAP transporter solute-binding subunit [Methylobacterium nodulans]